MPPTWRARARRHHRHPRRRPARPHAGDGGGAARLQVSCLVPEPGSPAFDVVHRVTGPTTPTRRRSTASPTTSTSSPTSSRTCRPRPRHFCRPRAGAARSASAGHHPGPARGKEFRRPRSALPPRRFAAVAQPAELAARVERIGRPAVLKTRRFGYDGKGQATIRNGADPRPPGARSAASPASSKPSCRSSAKCRSWPRAATTARRMFRRDRERAPRPHPENLARAGGADRRRRRARRGGSPRPSRSKFEYVGVLAVEMFVLPDGGEPAGQRDRAAGAQFRPLDPRRRLGVAIRAAHPGGRRLAARPSRCATAAWK